MVGDKHRHVMQGWGLHCTRAPSLEKSCRNWCCTSSALSPNFFTASTASSMITLVCLYQPYTPRHVS